MLKLLGALACKPLAAASLTPAVLYRVVEAYAPTILVDEADTFLAEQDELRGILNAGHDRHSAVVPRCVGDDFEPKVFHVFGAVAIAAIGKLPDTLMDRSVVIEMKRKAPAREAAEAPAAPARGARRPAPPVRALGGRQHEGALRARAGAARRPGRSRRRQLGAAAGDRRSGGRTLARARPRDRAAALGRARGRGRDGRHGRAAPRGRARRVRRQRHRQEHDEGVCSPRSSSSRAGRGPSGTAGGRSARGSSAPCSGGSESSRARFASATRPRRGTCWATSSMRLGATSPTVPPHPPQPRNCSTNRSNSIRHSPRPATTTKTVETVSISLMWRMLRHEARSASPDATTTFRFDPER